MIFKLKKMMKFCPTITIFCNHDFCYIHLVGLIVKYCKFSELKFHV